jgi:hypothetical protein
MGASTSWNPQGLSRAEMGLLYLFYLIRTKGTASERSDISEALATTIQTHRFMLQKGTKQEILLLSPLLHREVASPASQHHQDVTV